MELIKRKNFKNKVYNLHKLNSGKFQISCLLIDTNNNTCPEAEFNDKRTVFDNLEKAILFWNKNIEKN